MKVTGSFQPLTLFNKIVAINFYYLKYSNIERGGEARSRNMHKKVKIVKKIAEKSIILGGVFRNLRG